jgi:putative PIN family toxin of toxin-antitoxin system
LKVVIDTNVLISGIFWKGPPAEILKAWQSNRFNICLTLDIISEYIRVSQDISKNYPQVDIDQIIDLIIIRSEVCKPYIFEEQICEDPNDDMFIACAIVNKPSSIITGDKKLLKLNGFSEIEIIRPADFIKKHKFP